MSRAGLRDPLRCMRKSKWHASCLAPRQRAIVRRSLQNVHGRADAAPGMRCKVCKHEIRGARLTKLAPKMQRPNARPRLRSERRCRWDERTRCRRFAAPQLVAAVDLVWAKLVNVPEWRRPSLRKRLHVFSPLPDPMRPAHERTRTSRWPARSPDNATPCTAAAELFAWP